MRVQTQILFLCLLIFKTLLSQSKIQIIDKSTLRPISDVVITSKSGSTLSNLTGFFDITHFNKEDTLFFQHVLYKSLNIPYSKIFSDKIVKLSLKNITTKEILISAEKNYYTKSVSKQVIKVNDEKSSQYSGVSELLKTGTTLFIKDYGGYAGLKTVSSRGMSSENTVVFFNEARVNDLRTGTFNFAEVDSRFINQIEYSKNDEFGMQSAGGKIALSSGNDNNENTITIGANYNSNNIKSYFASLKRAANKISYSINLNRVVSPNHYNYNFDGNNLQRSNADFSKSFVSGDLKWKSDKLIIKFYTHYSHLLNGLPGFVVTNNFSFSKASNLTNSSLSIININYALSNKLFYSSNISYHNQLVKLIDPQNQLLIDRKSQSSTFGDFGFTNNLKFNYGKFRSQVNYLFHYGTIDSLTAVIQGKFLSNSSKRNEHVLSASIVYDDKLKGFRNINFSSSISYQYIVDNFLTKTDNKYFSYRIGLQVEPNFLKTIKFVVSFVENYRHPSFNEVYYSSLFASQNLQGEKYRSLNGSINLNYFLFGQGNIEFTVFTIWGNNKIIWIPTRLALQVPHNIKKIKSDGFEIAIKQKLFNKLLNIEVLYSFVDTRNKTFNNVSDLSFDKQLVYTPKNRWNFNTYFNLENTNISLNASYIGERFYTTDNSEQNKLDAYFLLDASVGYKLNLFGIKQTLTVNAYNIFNSDYFVIQSYPMPQNTYSINYQMRF